MKHIPSLILLSTFVIPMFIACNENKDETKELQIPAEEQMMYDEALAKSLGADEYGMKTYVMAFLKRGPNPPLDSIESVRLQAAHMKNISRLAEAGKLVLAGPFYGNDSLRGIYLFDTSSLDSALKWTNTDPAIQYGSLKLEMKKWYGSAAVMEVNTIHDAISKLEH